MLFYLKLIRPLNCLMASVAVLIGGLASLGLGIASRPEILLAALAGFLIAGAGNAINDYRDVEADRINRPERPIPSGKVSRRSALYFSVALFIIGIALSAFLNYFSFGLAVANSALLLIYPFYLKDKLLVGNIAISYLVGSTFLFGGASVGNLRIPLLLMLLSGLTNLSREIAKCMEDLEGDKVSFLRKIVHDVRKTIAERFGLSKGEPLLKYKKLLVFTGILCLVLAVMLSPLPFFWGIMGYSYLVAVVLADAAFLCSAILFLKAHSKRDFARVSKTIKLGMLLGLLAFIIGAVI